jgi:hypothetical protein
VVPPTEPGWNLCPNEGTPPRSRFDPAKYRSLPSPAPQLISNWSSIAVARLERSGGSPEGAFEAFIYAWFAFNGWASCCCGDVSDRELIRHMAADGRLRDAFDDLRVDGGLLTEQVRAFGALWPIFQSSSVRLSAGDAMRIYAEDGRRGLVDHYLREHPRAIRAPDCHFHHSEGIEPDWPHTLRALYRVRNNLFHGGKSAFQAADQEVIVAAAAVLVPTVQQFVERDYR